MAFLKNPTAHMLASAIKGENEYKKLVSSLSGYRIKNFKQPPAFVTGLSDTMNFPKKAIFRALP